MIDSSGRVVARPSSAERPKKTRGGRPKGIIRTVSVGNTLDMPSPLTPVTPGAGRRRASFQIGSLSSVSTEQDLSDEMGYASRRAVGGGRPAGMQVACLWAATGRIWRPLPTSLPLFRLAAVFKIDFSLPERNNHPPSARNLYYSEPRGKALAWLGREWCPPVHFHLSGITLCIPRWAEDGRRGCR